MKKYFSLRGIYLRFVLLIILPVIAVQLINAYVFLQRHWDSVSDYMNRAVIAEISYVFEEIAKYNMEQAKLATVKFNMRLTTITLEQYYELKGRHKYNKNLALLTNYLSISFADNYTVGFNKNSRSVYVSVLINDMAYYLEFGRKRIISPTTHIFIYSMIISSIIIFMVSFIFLKNQMRAIVRLSQAAERFGRGQNIEEIKPSGPFEIRSLAKSFIRMQKRISKQIKYRTELLGQIAHDLRTPLTRLKLKTEMLENLQDRTKIHQDLDEIDDVLTQYLNFAKAEGNENSVQIELNGLIKSIVAKYEGVDIKFRSNVETFFYYTKAKAFIRAISNVIDNAIKYSNSKVRISTQIDGNDFVISCDDDGNGITGIDTKEMFEPFVKGSNSKGYGLGLAIVKSIVNNHGGTVQLTRSRLGGVCISILLPI